MSDNAISKSAGLSVAMLEQWSALKYGMFIHFGLSTFTGIELDPGTEPSTTYAPTDIDADQWIRVAKEAGMTYAVLTAKHHPGHCLWDSKVTWRGNDYDYDVASSSNPTDVVAAFVEACNRHSVLPGLYWALLDFRNDPPDQPDQLNPQMSDDYFQLAKDQIAEMLTCYPTVRYLWLDIPRAASPQQRRELYGFIKNLSADCIVLYNFGLQGGEQDPPYTIASMPESWPTDILNSERTPFQPGGFTPHQSWQGHDYRVGYEHCDTITPHWFWRPDDMPRPTQELAALHQQVTAAGGNLLLNVPPDQSGRIPAVHVEALMDLKRAIDEAT